MRFIITLALVFISLALWSQTPGISASQETSLSGEEVSVMISVDNFEDVVSLQFTLEWDPTILAYQSTDDYVIPGLNEFNFGETDAASGILTFVWFDGLVNGVTLADGTAIFKITFTVMGEVGDVSAISFISTPTPIQVGIINGVDIEEIDGTFADGQVEIISNTLLAMESIIPNTCFGEAEGSISLDVNGGVAPYLYNWTGPDGFTAESAMIGNLAAGDYALTITDQDDNTFTSSFTILQPEELLIEELLLMASDCDQATGSISVTATGGVMPYTYDFGAGFDTSPEAFNLASAEYMIQILDANDCSIDTLVEVSQANAPVVELGADTAICAGQNLVLVADTENEVTYTWTLDGMPLADTGSELTTQDFGVYEVIVTTPDNCTASDQLTLSEATAPKLDLGEDQALCEAEMITLFAPEGLSYQWLQDGNSLDETSTTLLVDAAGTYTLIATNSSGCSSEDEILVAAAETPSLDLGPDLLLCPESTSSLFGESGMEVYQWFLNGEPIDGDDVELEVSKEGVYSLAVTSTAGCMNMDEVSVAFIDFETSASQDTVVLQGDTIQLLATGGETYSWSTSVELSCFDCPDPFVSLEETNLFEVTITSKEGCTSVERFEVAVIARPEVEIEIVNWLSPNGDGKNDVLRFRGLENYNSNQLTIYNRWGTLIYNKANYQLDNVFWDASFNGQVVPDGVYYYILKVKSNEFVFKSSLTIVREN